MKIDVNFDFTTDIPRFWETYWNSEEGGSLYDLDIFSKKLEEYHKILWSRQLPNGEFFDLKTGKGRVYLTWKGYSFGSDSIINSFRYNKNKNLIMKVKELLTDYKTFMEEYTRKSYTIRRVNNFSKNERKHKSNERMKSFC